MSWIDFQFFVHAANNSLKYATVVSRPTYNPILGSQESADFAKEILGLRHLGSLLLCGSKTIFEFVPGRQ